MKVSELNKFQKEKKDRTGLVLGAIESDVRTSPFHFAKFQIRRPHSLQARAPNTWIASLEHFALNISSPYLLEYFQTKRVQLFGLGSFQEQA